MNPGGGLFSAPSHPGSIVSATTFHFRVRNENGWVRRALTTKVTIIGSSTRQEQALGHHRWSERGERPRGHGRASGLAPALTRPPGQEFA